MKRPLLTTGVLAFLDGESAETAEVANAARRIRVKIGKIGDDGRCINGKDGAKRRASRFGKRNVSCCKNGKVDAKRRGGKVDGGFRAIKNALDGETSNAFLAGNRAALKRI